MAVKTFDVCDFSRLAVTDLRLRRWRLWFLALMTDTQGISLSLFFLSRPTSQFGTTILKL